MPLQILKYRKITEKIIGRAVKINRYFGLRFPEIVYQRALMIELRKAGLNFAHEVERDILCEGKVIHKRRFDLIVENVMLLELKALKKMDARKQNQLLNYLRVFKIKVGILLNFGTPSLQFKRFVYTNNNP